MSDIVWPNGTKIKPHVTGSYGPRQPFWTPGGWTGTFHWGTDIIGFPIVKSPVNGVVTFAGYNGGFGNFVRVRADGPNAFVKGDEFGHAHLADIRVSRGQRVSIAQDLGRMGTTGRSTGIHLHWEVYPSGGSAVDSEAYMREALAATAGMNVPKPPSEEEIIMGAKEDIVRAIGASQQAVLSGVRREARFRKVFNTGRTLNIIGRPGKVLRLSNNATEADRQMTAIAAVNPLLFNIEEFNGTPAPMATTALLGLVDAWDPDGDHGLGKFVNNIFELTGGATLMVRSDGETYSYPSRHDVWADLRPVILMYKAQQVVALKKPGIAVLKDGSEVKLTPTEIDRANAQKPAGQTWS